MRTLGLVAVAALIAGLAWFGWAAHEAQQPSRPAAGPPIGGAVTPAVAVVQAARAGCPAVAADRNKLVTATAIALAESNGRVEAIGDTTITDTVWGPSISYWQIRSLKAHKGTGQPRDEDRLHDPVFNAQSMCSVSALGTNWRPWSVYLFGHYQARLGEAEAAVDDPMSASTPRPVDGIDESTAGTDDVSSILRLMGESGLRRWDDAGELVHADGDGGYLDRGYGYADPAVRATLDRMAQGAGLPNLSAAAAPGASSSNGSVSQSTPGVWRWPCQGPVTSGFGPRVAPTAGARTFHPGLDIACSSGTPAGASAAGRVVFAGWDGGFGNSVQLEHPGGWKTSYNHLQAVLVAEGAQVRAGEQVGLVGSTGVSTGPHLHFELWEAGQPVDPAPKLGG